MFAARDKLTLPASPAFFAPIRHLEQAFWSLLTQFWFRSGERLCVQLVSFSQCSNLACSLSMQCSGRDGSADCWMAGLQWDWYKVPAAQIVQLLGLLWVPPRIIFPGLK